MNTRNHDYCVILAGGRGLRLWPCSREDSPKQFLDFFGTGRTLLQQTFDRFSQIMPPDHIFITTNRSYLPLVREQLPHVAPDRILAEPVQRSTAPSVAWATHRILRFDGEAEIAVTPADQVILDTAAFADSITKGLRFVETHNALLTMGIRPTRPETGYGYIQMGDRTGTEHIYGVKAFTEKPGRDFAQMFMDSGEWLWNTGLFLANGRFLQQCMYNYMPAVLRQFDLSNPRWTIAEEDAFMQEHFRAYPNLSIDHGILEQSENVCVAHCHFGWADVGAWHSIHEAYGKDSAGNAVIDSEVIFDDARDNVVKIPRGKIAVIGGLEGYIVAERGNVLLVCKKEDSSALVRKYANDVALQKGKDFA